MKERLIWLDSIKGWLILIVILGHAIQYCLLESHATNYWWNLIYSFHMPAFMAVSGFVNYRATIMGGGSALSTKEFSTISSLFVMVFYKMVFPEWAYFQWVY